VADDLSTAELAELLVALERGVADTANGFRGGGIAVGGLFVAMAALFAVRGAWGIALVVLAFGAGITAISIVAVKKTSPARMQPVFDAVREHPGDVTWVRHYTTSDSMRLFVRHWIEVKTATHRFIMQAESWERLLSLLRRRCPGATFVD
jgi:hypothetical protein